MRSALLLTTIFGVVRCATADDGLPRDALDRIKAATVFIKVGNETRGRSGSGFLFAADGKSGLVATNEHVIAPLSKDDLPGGAVSVTFHSGQKHEITVAGVVIATDKSNDIAILRVRGLEDYPAPLVNADISELRETSTVFAVGFPFGEALSLTKRNPAVSITKGSVSSVRRNERDEVAQIQIDGSLNPGNSGGPVIDKSGHLVGIAVAKVTGSNLGIAIPQGTLTRMLSGRVDGIDARVRKIVNGVAHVEIVVRLTDPLKKIDRILVRIARNDSFAEFGPDKAGTWQALAGAQEAELKIDEQTASGTIQLSSGEKSIAYYSIQAVHVMADKNQQFSRPSDPFRVDYRADTTANRPTIPFRSKMIEVSAKAPADWIFKEAKRGTRLYLDSEVLIAELPDELAGGTCLIRNFADSRAWLEPYLISAISDGTVYAVMRVRKSGKEELPESVFAKLEKEGWIDVQGAVETTFPQGEDWRWVAMKKTVKKGDIILQLKTIRWLSTPVIFVFKG